MKKAVKILLAVIITMMVLFLAGSLFIGHQIVTGSTHLVTNEETMEHYRKFWKRENFDFDRFSSSYRIEPLRMESSLDGHQLPFDLITADGNQDIAVMAHGLMGNRLTNYPAAEIFLENGCNVLSYDQRSSGDNEAQGTTFGYLEKYDLSDCVHYARKQFPEARIFVWGESFGGATAILAVADEKVQKEVSGLILDCPVSNMAYMVEANMKKMEIPLPMDYLMFCGNQLNIIELGFSYEDVDCAAAAENIRIPTLIFNSRADQMTPEFMGREIYDRLAGDKKEIYTSENCAHTGIRNDEREIYTEKVLQMIK